MRIRHLAMMLSDLEPHPCNDVSLEQYSTDGDLAARLLFDIASFGDINDNSAVSDLGAGNGILGIAALKLGVQQVIFVETDIEACSTLEKNLIKHNALNSGLIVNEHISSGTFLKKVDLIICNPPWGRKMVQLLIYSIVRVQLTSVHFSNLKVGMWRCMVKRILHYLLNILIIKDRET